MANMTAAQFIDRIFEDDDFLAEVAEASRDYVSANDDELEAVKANERLLLAAERMGCTFSYEELDDALEHKRATTGFFKMIAASTRLIRAFS